MVVLEFGVWSSEFGAVSPIFDLPSSIFKSASPDLRYGAIDPAGLKNERNVRLPVFVERRRHADDHRLHFSDPAEIGRGDELSLIYHLPYSSFTDMSDVALSAVQQLNLFGIDINAQHRHTGAGELDRERQSYITKTYDRDGDGVAHRS